MDRIKAALQTASRVIVGGAATVCVGGVIYGCAQVFGGLFNFPFTVALGLLALSIPYGRRRLKSLKR